MGSWLVEPRRFAPPINDDITITDTKHKTITFEAMPFLGRNEFQSAGKKLNNESLQELVQYMENAKARLGHGKGRNGNGGRGNNGNAQGKHRNNQSGEYAYEKALNGNKEAKPCQLPNHQGHTQ